MSSLETSRTRQYGTPIDISSSSQKYGNSYQVPRPSHKYGKTLEIPVNFEKRSHYYDDRNSSEYGYKRPYEPPVDYDSDPPRGSYYRDTSGSGYISNDDRTVSEYTMEIERVPMADYGRAPSEFRAESRASYLSREEPPVSEYSLKVAHIPSQRSNAYAPSEYSYRSARTDRSARTERSAKTDRSYKSSKSLAASIPPSETETVKTKTSRFGKIEVETMSAPHPYCPNSKGICCLLILLNLALLLVTLGFIVVFNIHKPAFVWYLGICMLIFGFLTLFGTLIYCIFVCRDRPAHTNGDLYWTHHWRKSFATPEIHYTNSQHRYFPTNDATSIHSNGSPYYTHGEKISIHSNGTTR